MSEAFARMKRLVGFELEDEANLASLAPLFAAVGPGMVEEFYDIITDDPEISDIIEGRRPRLERMLLTWLTWLFAGDYGPSYVERLTAVGAAHARIGLPQQLVEGGMSLIRVRGAQAILEHAPSPARAWEQQRSLLRIIDLNVMVINQAYDAERIDALSGQRRIVIERLAELLPQTRR